MGAQLRQVLVLPATVNAPSPTIATLVPYLHVPTRATVILHDIGLEAGAPLDSLAVQESVRRLRLSGLFADVLVMGARCGTDGVDLTYRTRDAWSLRLDARLGRSESRFAASDLNLLGTGRAAGIQTDDFDDRRAVTISYSDPWLLNTAFQGAASLRLYGDGQGVTWSVRTRPLTPLDRWRVSVAGAQVQRYRRDDAAGTLTDIDRHSGAITVSRLIARTPTAAWAIVAGAEQEHIAVEIHRQYGEIGEPVRRREYGAPLLGVSRRALTFGALDWLVPRQLLAEVPTGIEFDAAVAHGIEGTSGHLLTHANATTSVTAIPSPDLIVSGEAHVNGYWTGDSVTNGVVRLAVTAHQRAPGGFWTFRMAHERLIRPDPDVFTLQGLDPLARSLTPSSRLSEWATVATVERSRVLFSSGGVWSLHGAAFVTGVDRHNTVSDVHDPLWSSRSVIVGLGLRRFFAQPTQAPLRVDLGRGISRSSRIPDRWVMAVTVSPWLNSLRGRGGARDTR